MQGAAWAILALLMIVPAAAASDPFRDQQCVPDTGCLGPGSCTAVACVPGSCQPVAYCYGTVVSADECAENATIEGRTCQGIVGVGAQTNTPGQEAWVGVAMSDGHVDAFHAPNTWVSPSAQVMLVAGGVQLGTVSVGVYRGVIEQDGHEWTNVALVAGAGDGLTGGETASVTVQLLDGVPEDCRAQTSQQTVLSCRAQREFVRETLS